MNFDLIDDRNTMIKSILQFKQVTKTRHENSIKAPHPKYELDVVYMNFDLIGDRNTMVKSILQFKQVTKTGMKILHSCAIIEF